MFKKTILALAAAGLSSLASASTFDLLSGSPTDRLAIDGISQTFTLDAGAADTSASLSFALKLYDTVDGYNGGYIDVFSVIINNKQVFSGTFQGPGGQSGTGYFSLGATPSVDVTSDLVTVSGLSFKLNSGSNTISFIYAPLGPLNYGGQSIGDEGWGLNSATVTAVPEPETYAMFLAGLGLVGAIARRRRARS